MKTEREVLEYVYDRMVGVHLEQSFQWYMLELRRIIGERGAGDDYPVQDDKVAPV